jgi:hypothetical protein
MEICITIGRVRHCYHIPVIVWPGTHFPPPGPGPVNYPALVADAVVVSSVFEAAGKVVNEKARGALLSGVKTAIAAMQAEAGEHVEIVHAAK